MFAVIATGGKQYKVAVGDVLAVEKLDAEVDGEVAFPVLMVVNDKDITVGKDAENVQVKANVIEQFKDKKLRVFKYRNKSGYRRKLGHRQPLTRIRITSIDV